MRTEINYILFERNWGGTTLYDEYISGEILDEEGYSALDKLVDIVSDLLQSVYYPRIYVKDREIKWINTVRKIIIEMISEQDDFDYKENKFDEVCMYNNLRYKRIKESYDSLEEDIVFILFERDWEGTTLYEAYKSGEFDNDEDYDPFDRLADEVCDILEGNPDVYGVPEFNTMEAESRWYRKVRNLIVDIIRLKDLTGKM